MPSGLSSQRRRVRGREAPCDRRLIRGYDPWMTSRIALVQSHGGTPTHTDMSHRLGGAAAAIALVTLAACSGINAQTNSFATLAEARAAGAIAKGWMPEGLPPGSHDIREGHVPGTTERWGIIDFPQAEEASLRALLQPDEMPLTGQRCEIPPRIEWWPLMLRGSLDGTRLSATGIRVYRAKEGNLIFAVNWSQGRAYFWTPAS